MPQSAQTCRACTSGIVNACGPGSPDSHRVVWGLTSRPPVSPAGFPPVSRLPAGFSPSPAFSRFPFVRRSPVRPLRPLPGFRFPFGVPPVSLPLSNLHDSAAEGRFRRRWSRAARAKVTSPATTTPRLDLAVIRPALQMGNGWARGDRATESPVTSGRERSTAAPEPARSAGMCATVLADHGPCSSGRSGGPGGPAASHAASQKGWRALRVHRHSAARVSVTQPPDACIRRSPRRRKGPRSTARMVAGTSGCSPGIPGAW